MTDLNRASTRPAESRLETAVAVGASLFAAIAVLIATSRGPGVNPDSANYLSAGVNLADGRGLLTYGGGTLTIFPPGLPALIALGEWIGIGAEWTVRVVNAAAFSSTVWMGFVLLRRHVRTTALVIAGTCLLAFGTPLLTMSEMAWTEPLFITVSLGFILVLEELIRSVRRWPWLLGAVVLVWAGFMLRYAGISLVPAGGLAILLGVGATRTWRRALIDAVTFGTLASVVPVAWMLRNHSIDGTFMGPRSPSIDEPIGTLARFVATLGRWLVPSPAPRPVQAAAGVAIVALAGFAVLRIVVDRRRSQAEADTAEVDTTPVASDAGTSGPEDLVALAPLVTFMGVYSAYLIAAQLTTAFDQIGNRLMSPLFVPFMVLVVIGADRLVAHFDLARRGTSAARLLGGALVVVVAVHGLVFVRQVAQSAREGVGYTARSWLESELIERARDIPSSAAVFSNAPAGLWAGTHREPIKHSPERRVRRSEEQVPMSTEFLETVACGDTYLVWFDGIPGSFLFSPDELSEYVQVEAQSPSDGGQVYRLSALDPDAPADCS